MTHRLTPNLLLLRAWASNELLGHEVLGSARLRLLACPGLDATGAEGTVHVVVEPPSGLALPPLQVQRASLAPGNCKQSFP